MSDLKKLVRTRRQAFNFKRSKDSLPNAEVIKMPFNSDFRENLGSGALDSYINNAIENSGQPGALNKMLGRNTKDFHEAKVISMGKYKEKKNVNRLMGGSNE
jgi:hypothetical protein